MSAMVFAFVLIQTGAYLLQHFCGGIIEQHLGPWIPVDDASRRDLFDVNRLGNAGVERRQLAFFERRPRVAILDHESGFPRYLTGELNQFYDPCTGIETSSTQLIPIKWTNSR